MYEKVREHISETFICEVKINNSHSKSLKLSNRLSNIFMFLGPAFVVSVAYIDPGNFATNIYGGSLSNYSLLWVILWSNIMAIFLQCLSAKLGIATGSNLPEMCNKYFSKKTNIGLWIFAEISAMATDLAEFLGGSLGFYLLFRIPMIYAGLLTAIITFFIVWLEKYGQRLVELIITIFIAIICIMYSIELFLAKPDWVEVSKNLLLPRLGSAEMVLVATSMLGATVMPHVIYLHSELVKCRSKFNNYSERLRYLKLERLDIALAMNIAFIINASMLIVSAAVFYKNGLVVNTIELAHISLKPILGPISSGAFGLALLVSGLASSAVGTLAGQTIIKGFLKISIPLNIRRLITMIPAIIIISLGINTMKALILSQVLLCISLPAAIVPLLLITSRKGIMGELANKPITNIIGIIVVTSIILLNILLIFLQFKRHL